VKKNVASQSIGAEMITAADGTAFTGSVSVLVTKDNGTQTAGGATAPAHEGNGYHSYSPTQTETDADHIAFTFTGTGAIPATVQLFTSFPQTADNATDISSILTDTSTTIPAQITALNDFDPSSDTVANVTTVATTTTNTDMRGTNSANTVVPPSVAQFNARTILSADYFDPATDTVANVALVATTTTNTDMAGTNNALLAASYTAPDNAGITSILADTNELQLNQGDWLTATGFSTSAEISALNDLSFSDVWTGTLTESYAVNGAAMTPAQSLHMMWSDLRSPQQVSTTWTDFRLNNTTAAMTFTLDNATTPTKKTRAS